MIQSIKIYGDQAILINFEQQIDTAVNAAVVALQNAINQANIEGITFLIPAYCSLTVGYNPTIIDHNILVEVIKQIAANSVEKSNNTTAKQTTRQIRIPVCYEAPYALDIQALSKEKGIAIEKIIELHTSQTYKVYMLGFLPGFVFMGKIPAELQCNRKVTPRLRVPASSVGIAGFQTGIYPTVSPGGWQILGRTPLKIFNPQIESPFLFQAGDDVQFYSIDAAAFERIEIKSKQKDFNLDTFVIDKERVETQAKKEVKKAESPITNHQLLITKLHFQKAGLQTLIQDQGRIGYQSYGVPVSGAMDKKAAAIANELVGNDVENPVLEITLLGPTIKIEGACQIAITGANLLPKINKEIIPLYTTVNVKNGDILSFGGIKNGCRAYVAIRGHWQLSKWLDSYSALPYSGKEATPKSVIEKGQTIMIETPSAIEERSIPKLDQPIFNNSQRIRVLPGPEFEAFSSYTIAYFFSRGYKLTNDSNRMGYRLDGNLIDFKPKREVISSGIIPGTIQITSSGQPVILMADAQTVGGYYRIANVIAEDMDKLAQLKPGEEVWFSLVRRTEI